MRGHAIGAGVLAVVVSGGSAGLAASALSPPEGMVLVPGGTYLPFLAERNSDAPAGSTSVARIPVEVGSFFLDVFPVTNAEFLEFVKRNPRWSRSRVPSVFADRGYLAHWAGDFDLGDPSLARVPVTRVSWFAARAYCRAVGKDLPTLDQWEYAAFDQGRNAEEIRRRLLDWNGRPNPSRLPEVGATEKNGYGIADLHGVVWEWVRDFNSVLLASENRDDASSDPTLFCGGGAFASRDPRDYPTFLRFAFRASLQASHTTANLGFRCSREAGP